MSDSVIPWTVACQALLSTGFTRQEYLSGLPLPTPEHLFLPGIEPASPVSPVLVGGFFTTEPPGKPKEIRWRTRVSENIGTIYQDPFTSGGESLLQFKIKIGFPSIKILVSASHSLSLVVLCRTSLLKLLPSIAFYPAQEMIYLAAI